MMMVVLELIGCILFGIIMCGVAGLARYIAREMAMKDSPEDVSNEPEPIDWWADINRMHNW